MSVPIVRCRCGHSQQDHWPGGQCLVPRCDCMSCDVTADYAPTEAEAEAFRERVTATNAAPDGVHVEKWCVGETSLGFIVRIRADGTVTNVDAFAPFSQTVREAHAYEEVWEDGTAFDGRAPTYEEALRLARAKAGVPHA